MLFAPEAWAAGPGVPIKPPKPFREDRLLIVPKPGHEAALEALHRAQRGKVRRKFPGLGNVHVIEVPPGSDIATLIDRYKRSGHVEGVEPDQWFHPAATPSDPIYLNGLQWHLHNTGQSFGVPDADIDAPEGWDTQSSASNIVVAVVDTGVRYTHTDIAANMWVNPGEIPDNGVDDDNNGVVDDIHGIDASVNPVPTGTPTDGFGHGAHVAGIIGAVGNNGLGVCGVAWQVRLMSCKFINANGSGSTSDLIECLDYARTNGARVLNCSFVGGGSFSSMLSNAFWNVRMAGIVVIAAAGNSGINHDLTPIYPASFKIDNIVAVAATTRHDDLWMWSDYGATTVHLAAPGTEIYTTHHGADDGYAQNTGTSMAAAVVSGVAALMRARFPTESAQQIAARLFAATEPLPGLAGKCITGGRLSLRKALMTDPYTLQPATYDWVGTNGMTAITLADNGVSPAQSLPFPFRFYGQTFNQLFIGANGLISFAAAGLQNNSNLNLPTAGTPNASLCAYWDDLNPAAGGQVWIGTYGQAPNRKVVASWVAVPHFATSGGPTVFTLQSILHESGHISFQYQQVETGNPILIQGKSASIGLEDPTGQLAVKYTFNGSPAIVTNRQALVFAPLDAGLPAPTLAALPALPRGQFRLQVSSAPSQTCVVLSSSSLSAWSPVLTNTVPASGVRVFTDPDDTSSSRFFRAMLVP